MLHTVLSILGLRDQGVQLVQVGSHFLAEVDLLRLDATVRDIHGGVVRRLHRHHLVDRGFWLLLLLRRVGIRLLGLVTRRSTAGAHLSLEQRSQTAANVLRNSLFHTWATVRLPLFLHLSRVKNGENARVMSINL